MSFQKFTIEFNTNPDARLTNIQNDCGGYGAYVTLVYGRNTIAEAVSARLLVSSAMFTPFLGVTAFHPGRP